MSFSRRTASGAAVAVLSMSALAGCTGGGSAEPSPAGEDATPTEVLAAAKTLLDQTTGIELSLSTDDTPDTDSYLRSAEGVVTASPPAFEGTATGAVNGLEAADIAIVSVDGDFSIELPVVGFTTLDPTTLCAPDPAQLLDTSSGVSSVLISAEDPQEGDSERGGPDNAEVLTSYTATVPGAAIKNVLPCAPGDSFDARFTVNEAGYLRSAELTGEFFSGGGELTYDIDISSYDVEQEITSPDTDSDETDETDDSDETPSAEPSAS